LHYSGRRRGDASAQAEACGDCAAFAKSSGNGRHSINYAKRGAVYLEIGSRSPIDVITCSDIDMMSPSSDGRVLHKDGTPY
jgi:uncharacterized cupin superfamily protein